MGRARRPQDPPVHSLSVFILGLFLLIIAVLLALASVYVLFVDDVWIKGVAEALKITKQPVARSNFEVLVITVAGSLCTAAFNSATSLKAAWDDPNKNLVRSDLIFTYAFGMASAIVSSLLVFVLLRARVALGSGDLQISSIGNAGTSTGTDAWATKLIYFIVGVGAGATPPSDILKSARDTAAKVSKRVGQSVDKKVDSMGK